MEKRVLITGTGLAGLTAALRLAKRGFNVTMVEKFHQPGGRLNQIKKDGYTFDMAPTFFAMSYEFQEFIEDCNIEPPFTFQELDPLYAVNFRNSRKFYHIYKDLDKLAKEFKDIEPGFKNKMERFLKSSGKFFHDVEGLVIKKNYNSLFDFFFTMTKVPVKHAPLIFRNVWKEMNRYFESDQVKEIFSLVIFFLGATPFDTPALYKLLSYTELVHDGYHNVKGGMYKIVEGLVKEIEKQGIKIHYNTEIVDFEAKDSKIVALTDQYGNKWNADIFLINADAAVFRGNVLKREKFSAPKLDKKKWTLAPFTMYLGIDTKIDNIHHHNYFLGDNFKEYSENIFKNTISLDKPYYYVNAVSKSNPGSAPQGHESLFILCPVADLRYKPSWADREKLAKTIIQDLSERINFNVKEHIVSKTILTPIDWEKAFNLHRGSGLGLAHDMNQIGGFRPKNYDEVFKNVFYAGSSTVPGTGLPMAVISSKLAVERIMAMHEKFIKKQKDHQ